MIDESKYENVWHLSKELPEDDAEGAALVQMKDRYAILNRKGESLIEFDDIKTIGENGAFVKEGDKWGYIDTQGNWLVSPRYDDTWYLTYPDDDLTAMGIGAYDNKYALLNRNCEAIVEFDELKEFNDRYGGFAGKDGKWGFLNLKGEWVIEPQFLFYPDFFRGIAYEEIDGKYVFLKKDGTYLTDRRFEEASYFRYYTRWGNAGVAPVRVADLWGFIGTDGEWVFKPQFDDLQMTTDVVDGPYISVYLKGKEGYLKQNDDGEFFIDWKETPERFYSEEEIESNLKRDILMECYVTGVHKYLPAGSSRWDELVPEMELVMIRDRENPYDKNAVAVALAKDYNTDLADFNMEKIIGYIPKKYNSEPAEIIDGGKGKLTGKIMWISDSGNPNTRLMMRIYRNED